MCEPKRTTGLGPVLTIALDAACVVFVWKVLDMIQAGLWATFAVGTVGGVVALGVVVRYVHRTGPMWRPDRAAVPEQAVERQAVAPAPSLAALPVRQPAAIPAPRIVAGVVLERKETR